MSDLHSEKFLNGDKVPESAFLATSHGAVAFDNSRNDQPHWTYGAGRRLIDIVVAAACLPALLLFSALIFVANFFYNPGSLFFCQERMGKDGKKFIMFKFRTMSPELDGSERSAFGKLETDRITPLGSLLRKTRIDEIPQIINLLLGNMTLIGPRPDKFDFAREYVERMPGYALRQQVKPGITGYAQVVQGYADTRDAVANKVALDLHYLRNQSWSMDVSILLRTVVVITSRRGA